MKHTLYLIAIILFSANTALAQNLLKTGDNIHTYFTRNHQDFTQVKQINTINNWPDITVNLSVNKNWEQGYPSPVGAHVNKGIEILFGALQGSPPDVYFLMDMDGDGTLDTKVDDAITPYWFYFAAEMKRGNNKKFMKMLDHFYESFQGDERPEKSKEFKTGLNLLKAAKNNVNIINRDLYFALQFYFDFTKINKKLALNCLQRIHVESNKRFRKKHPLLILFAVETLIDLNQFHRARKVNNELLEIDPKSISGQVYDYMFYKSEAKRKHLIKNHGDHWMVKFMVKKMKK